MLVVARMIGIIDDIILCFTHVQRTALAPNLAGVNRWLTDRLVDRKKELVGLIERLINVALIVRLVNGRTKRFIEDCEGTC